MARIINSEKPNKPKITVEFEFKELELIRDVMGTLYQSNNTSYDAINLELKKYGSRHQEPFVNSPRPDTGYLTIKKDYRND